MRADRRPVALLARGAAFVVHAERAAVALAALRSGGAQAVVAVMVLEAVMVVEAAAAELLSSTAAHRSFLCTHT